MKSKLSGIDSANMPDLSILRKPIATTITGFIETIQAFENGTPEIRNLLSSECDILYECKVCRNIFRSLANFISHKRVYCRVKFNSSHHFHFRNNGFIDQDISTILQTDGDNNDTDGIINKEKSQDIINKDLGSIIERLMKKQKKNEDMKLTEFYKQVDTKLQKDDFFKNNHTLKLDKMDTSNNAVYQTVQHKNDNNNRDSMKKEINEVYKLTLNKTTEIDSIDKITNNNIPIIDNNNEMMDDTVLCDICNLKFDTEKMLKLHIEIKHIPSTIVYQCPTCSKTFLQPAAVIKHLCNDHNKSLRKIRLMRETIYKKRTRIDEVQIKGPSRELMQLKMDQNTNTTTEENIRDNITDINSLCPYCGKSFERKVVLASHINACLSKSKVKPAIGKSINKCKENENSEEKIENNNNVDVKIPLVNSIIKNDKESILDQKITSNKRKRKHVEKMVKTEIITDPISSSSVTIDEIRTVSPKICIPATNNINDSKKIESEQEKIIECDICEKKFLKISNLKRHIAMFHYRSKNFGCKICDFRAYRRYDITNHIGHIHLIKDNVPDYVIILKNDDKKLKDTTTTIKDTTSLKNSIISKNDNTNEKNNSLINLNNSKNSQNLVINRKKNRFKLIAPATIKKNITSNNNSSIIIKRPIRNRIKPIQKDFVYDLSNLLKKEQELNKEYLNNRGLTNGFPVKIPKRRNTLPTIIDDTQPHNIIIKTEKDIEINNKILTTLPIIEPNIQTIKGAALEMANIEVISSMACFKKNNIDIPSVKYVIPAKIQVLRKSDPIQDLSSFVNNKDCINMKLKKIEHKMRAQQIVKKISETFRKKKLNSSNLINNQTEKIEQPKLISTNSLLNEVSKIPIKCPTEKEFQQYLVTNRLTEPIKKIVLEVPELILKNKTKNLEYTENA